jgi:hypothetical protein
VLTVGITKLAYTYELCDTRLIGEWVAIPREDFDRLFRALRRLNETTEGSE